MAAVDKVRFHAPIRVGEFLDMTANVTRVGRTSMTVNVAAHAEKPGGSNRRAVMEGQFEMVAVDENGRPSAIERPS
jgi:acyl-CoA hydrolase